MVIRRYFYIQKLSFKLCGIDTEATKPEVIVRRPLLCCVPLFFAMCHLVAIGHYAYVNRHDYVEVTDSLALFCQSLLAIWKMFIFLCKRRHFVAMINDIHLVNFKAAHEELQMIISENTRDDRLSTIYFRAVVVAAFLAFMNPIFEAIYIYWKVGQLVLRVPYKASYFWNHSELPGYTLVYFWNVLSIYNLFGITLAIDTLFNWLVSNISAHFHILCFRFNEAAKTCSTRKSNPVNESSATADIIKSCLEYHRQTLQLATKLNKVYKEIIFIKFIISCSEICCLVFRLSRPSDSMSAAAYQCTFLLTVAMQLMLYCYNGQRIRNESLQVSPEIYFAFDWSQLEKSCQELLFLPMMRAQNSSQIRAVFFVLDLSLFLWAFKTAASLIAALKTLEENQN